MYELKKFNCMRYRFFCRGVLDREREHDELSHKDFIDIKMMSMCQVECREKRELSGAKGFLLHLYISGELPEKKDVSDKLYDLLEKEQALYFGDYKRVCDLNKNGGYGVSDRYAFYCFEKYGSYLNDDYHGELEWGMADLVESVRNLRRSDFKSARIGLDKFYKFCGEVCYLSEGVSEALEFAESGSLSSHDCKNNTLLHPESIDQFLYCFNSLFSGEPTLVYENLKSIIKHESLSLELQIWSIKKLFDSYEFPRNFSFIQVESKLRDLDEFPYIAKAFFLSCDDRQGICGFSPEFSLADVLLENGADIDFLYLALDDALRRFDGQAMAIVSDKILGLDHYDPMAISVKCVLAKGDRDKFYYESRIRDGLNSGRVYPPFVYDACSINESESIAR